MIPVLVANLVTWQVLRCVCSARGLTRRAQELEQRVCGSGDLTVDVIRGGCEYSGFAATDVVIEMFWAVMATFSIKFVALHHAAARHGSTSGTWASSCAL